MLTNRLHVRINSGQFWLQRRKVIIVSLPWQLLMMVLIMTIVRLQLYVHNEPFVRQLNDNDSGLHKLIKSVSQISQVNLLVV